MPSSVLGTGEDQADARSVEGGFGLSRHELEEGGCVLEGTALVFDGVGDFKPATFFQVFSVQDSFSSYQSYVGFDRVGGGHCLDELGGISLGARLAISITAIIAVAAILRIR